MQVEQGQAAITGCQHAPPASFRLAPGGLGQPAGAPGARLATVPGAGGRAQVPGGLVPPAGGHGHPAGEQVSVDGPGRVELVQPCGHPAGRSQQRGRTARDYPEAAAQQDQLGPGGPPGALLAAEQAQGLSAAVLREAEVAVRGSGQSRGVQQLGPPRGRAAVPLDRRHRRVGLAQGIPGQPRREQDRDLVDGQFGLEDPQLVEQALGVVKVGERGGEVAAGVCRFGAFLADVRVLQVLPARRVQGFGAGVVLVGSLGITQDGVRHGPVVQGPRLPYRVTRTGQQVDRGLGVPQRVGTASQHPEGVGPADQDPAGRDATVVPHQGVQDRQAALRLPGQEPGHAQARADVGLPIQVPRPAGEPARVLELPDRVVYVTEMPQHHAGRLVRDGRLRRRRVLRQHLAGGGQGFRRARQSQGEQFVRLPGQGDGLRGDRHL